MAAWEIYINMNTKSLLSRRQFLARSAAATLAGAVIPSFVPSGVLAAPGQPGANGKLNIGFIGIGRRAGDLLRGSSKLGEARIAGFADVNLKRAQENASKTEAAAKDGKVFACQDYRQLLERKDIDAIITATPEHWRILIVLAACQAGKHLYVEKPITLTIKEGRWMTEAVRKYKVIFQSGSQQRSDPLDIAACEFVRSGGLGKINKVVAANYPTCWDYNIPGQPTPPELDWNTWCGPAPLVPYNEAIYVPREKGPIAPGWLSLRPHSGGEVTGWGAHGFDMIQYALGMDNSGPVEIWPEGKKYEAPVYTAPESKKRGDAMTCEPVVYFKYANGVVVEPDKDKPASRGKGKKPADENDPGKAPSFGAIFYGEKGWLKIDRGRVSSFPDEISEGLMKAKAKGKSNGDHILNWLQCIKENKLPTADVEIGHRSATVCHLVNIARWTGRKLKWDPAKEEFIGDAEANKYLDRERRKGFEVPAKI